MKRNQLFRWLFATLAVATVTFSGCKNDEDEQFDIPTLEVSPTELAFDENGGPKSFQITTTGSWTITGAEDLGWLAVTPALEGTGDAEITVTLDGSTTAREAELTITCFGTYFGIDKEIDSKTVRITQTIGGEAPSTEEFYYNDFDREAAQKTYGESGDRWPYLDQFDGWQNQTGSGAQNVEYTYESMSARNTSNSDGGYSDYEGSGVNNIFFGGGAPTFTIGNIAVNTVNLRLTFGATRYLQNADNTFVIEDFDVQLSADGQSWSEPIAYAFPAGADINGRWNLATADFTLPEGTTTVWIRFSSAVASVHRIDDVRLTGGVGGDLIEFTQGGGDDTPSEAVAITIPEIIAQLTSEQVVLDETNDRTFEAVVVTDKEGGNVNSNHLQVMTPGATEPCNGITLYGSGVTNPNDESFNFVKGDRVRVTLKAGLARIVNYSGLYEVTGSQNETWVEIEKIGTETITPVLIAASDLAAYQGMAVTLTDMTSPATADLWCAEDAYGQHVFTTGGENVTVFVQAGMPGLAGTRFVAGATGSVTGYATVYKDNPQICPQRPADVAAFMSQDPAITVSPSSLNFASEGGSLSVEVTKINADDTYTIEASATGGFSASVSGTTVTVTIGANSSESPVEGSLTVNLMKDGSVVATQTVSLRQGGTLPAGAGSVSMTLTEIQSGKTGTVELSTNNYGGMDLTDLSTYYTWTAGGVSFGGCKICVANGDYTGLLQMQGNNGSDEAKMGILGNTTSLGKILRIVVTTKNTKYEPSYSLYVGDTQYPLGNKQDRTITSTTDGGMTTYVETYDLSAGNYSYFSMKNNTTGATYFESIEIVYEN